MRKAGRKNKLESLEQKEADLLAQLEEIKKLKAQQEQEKKRESEGKSYVVNKLTSLFEGFSYKLNSEKEKFENSEEPYDNIIAEFIGSRIHDFSRIVENTLNRASKKQTIEQFQRVIAKTLSATSHKEEWDEEETNEQENANPISERSTKKITRIENVKPHDIEAPDSLPLWPTMWITWYLLTKYDFSKPTTQSDLKQAMLKKEIVYGSRTIWQVELIQFAKDIFDAFSDQSTLTDHYTIGLSLNNKKMTVAIYSVMKSFFKYAENNVLIKPVKLLDEIKDEEFMGKLSIERFLKLLHITVKPNTPANTSTTSANTKEPPMILSQADVDKLNMTLKSGWNGGNEKEISPALILNFGSRKVNIREEESILKSRSTTSNQIMHMLMKWFNHDLYVLAQLLEKTKIRRFDEDYMKNINYTHTAIERLTFDVELKNLCIQSYELLLQFHKFADYYFSLHTDNALRDRFKISFLPLFQIDIMTTEWCREFLKRVMPTLGHKKNTHHIYSFFIGFLNKVKGDPIAISKIIPKIEDVLRAKKQEDTVEKVIPVTKKLYNNNSELMADWSPETIDKYLVETCKIGQIQELYNHIRSARSSDIMPDDYKQRDIYLNDSRMKILDLWKNNLVPSRDKVNAMVKYLFDLTRGQRNNNSVLKMIKNAPKPVNFVKELRMIIQK